MQTTLSVILTIKSEVVQSLMIDGKECLQASYIYLYEGEMHGIGIVATVPFGNDDQIYGIERFSGTIGEMSGTFVLESYGIERSREGNTIKTIVPGSGTKDFLGIKGAMTLVSVNDKKNEIAFHCEFESKLTKEDQPLSE